MASKRVHVRLNRISSRSLLLLWKSDNGGGGEMSVKWRKKHRNRSLFVARKGERDACWVGNTRYGKDSGVVGKGRSFIISAFTV